MQNSNLNTNLTSSTSDAIAATNSSPIQSQSTGLFARVYNGIVNMATTPNERVYLKRIKEIDASWGDLLMDLASYAVEKKIKSENNQQGIDNVSELIAEVLLAMGAIHEKEDQVLNSKKFAKHLITNLLDELYKYDLTKFDLGIESEDTQTNLPVEGTKDEISLIKFEEENTSELDSISSSNDKMIVLSKNQSKGGEKKLEIELAKIFNNFLENIGLDQEHIKNRSDLIQWALYPNALIQFVKMFPGIPDIDKDKLKAIFIQYGVELCKVQKRLELKSCDKILLKNEGATALADYFVEKQIKSLQENGLSLEYSFLTHKKNKSFLTSNINQALLKEPGVEDDGVISWAWGVISDQIKMAIKAILAVVLNPNENETAEDRRNHLLDAILNQLGGKSKELLMQEVEQINQMKKSELCAFIEEYSNLEGSPYQLEAKKLFNRRDSTWLADAQKFYNDAWHSHVKLHTRDELLRVLNTWEEHSKTDPLWKDAHSAEAKALIASESFTWKDEAQHFLKVIVYDKMARNVLNEELCVEKFSAFFPSFFPASNVFQPLYKLIGEKSLELHEHINSLKVKGDDALYLLEADAPELTGFIDSLLTGFITAIEEKAAKGEEVIDLGYPFLNDMISHLIQKPKEEENANVGKELFKIKVIAVVEDILMTVLADTIQNNCTEAREAANVFPFLIDKMIEKALEGFEDINESCKTVVEKYDSESTSIAIKGLSEKLGFKAIKVKKTKEERAEQVKELLIKILARDLTDVLLPQELFNSLLPPMFRESKLWEMIGDKLIAPYISDIYEKVETFQSAAGNADSEAAKKYVLNEDIRGKIFPIIDTVVEKMNKSMSSIKFGKLLQSEDKEKSQIDFSVLDKFFGKALEKNGQISHLIGSAVPKIIESIFAFHLNPKNNKTSQELATGLLWDLLNAANKCCETIDSVKLAWGVSGLEDASFFKKAVSKKDLADYRKEKKIDLLMKVSREEYKQCYIWVQTNQVLIDTVNDLMDQLVPEELWNERVPEQFRKFLTRAQVGTLVFDYLKDWYEFSTEMKGLMHSGKEQIGKSDDLENTGGFIEDKVKVALADFCELKGHDKPDEIWLKKILKDLLKQENFVCVKPVTNLAIKYAYAILGKVLSGHIPGLSDSEILIKSLTESEIFEESSGKAAVKSEKSSPVVLKVNALIPAIQENYHKLNALDSNIEAFSCRDFNQIKDINLAIYLSAIQDPALKAEESILGFTNEFVMEEERIVFKVQFQNEENKEIRTVSLDLCNFIYWELAYRSIDSLIPKEGWKELMPKFLRKVITKEFLATFAIPHVKAAHMVQAPLQKKAEEGESLVAKLNEEAMQVTNSETKFRPGDVLNDDYDSLLSPIHSLETEIDDSNELGEQLARVEKAKCDLDTFINVMILDKLALFMADLANKDEAIITEFPNFIDALLKEFLKTQENVNVKQIREALTRRAVYLLINEFLKPAAHVEGKGRVSATERSAISIREKLNLLVNEYYKGIPSHGIAQKIVDIVIPKETWETIFTDKDKEPITREEVVKMVDKSFVNESCKKIIGLKIKHETAIKVIHKLDKVAGLKEGKIGGLTKMVQTICASIDAIIDEYSEKKEKIFDQPLLFNEVAKELFRDPTTSGLIKESAHALVNICIAKLFLVKKGESPEKKLLEVLARMGAAYNVIDLNKTAVSWLKEVISEDFRKRLLPEFLHNVITHEFLAEAIFKEYMDQIAEVANLIENHVAFESDRVHRMQNYVKNTLVAFKNESSRDGLSGFGGFVKNLEKVFLEVSDAEHRDVEGVENLDLFLDKILNANIAQIMAQHNVVGVLDSKTFISEALAAALPMFGTVDVEEGFVELTDDELKVLTPEALKDLGIVLPRKEDEADADFRARIRKWHFEVKSGEMIAEIVFPGKAASLLVPEIAQDSVWNNVIEALGNQVGRVTDKDSRILLAINLLGFNQEDEGAFKELEEYLIDNKDLVGKEDIAESLFKKGLKNKVMEKVDAYFDTWNPLLAPLTWLARLFTKVVISLALHFGVSQQAWNSVSSAESDEKLRRMIWKFLSFTKNYQPEEIDSDKLAEEVGTKVQKVMEDMHFLEGLQWFVGPQVAAALKDKQALSFLPL